MGLAGGLARRTAGLGRRRWGLRLGRAGDQAEEVAGCAPIPADATGDRIRSVPCAAAAPQWQYPALPVPVGSVLLPARRPLALQRWTARRAERAAIVQADYDKSIDQDQRSVKV
ncbi:hypothetical protein G6F31_018482 [Rhizopus arrhizus]|nr:hypothetical protein G6F31_018482 [Rhizopus arrhizus]